MSNQVKNTDKSGLLRTTIMSLVYRYFMLLLLKLDVRQARLHFSCHSQGANRNNTGWKHYSKFLIKHGRYHPFIKSLKKR